MSDIDAFTDALVRAFDTRFDQRSEEGQRLFRSCYGPSIHAVARVALERAAEVALNGVTDTRFDQDGAFQMVSRKPERLAEAIRALLPKEERT